MSYLSITIQMLKDIWAKNKGQSPFRGNKVTLIHPNGWYFILGKFRIVPVDDIYRVRMHICFMNGDTLSNLDSYIRFLFGIDLDDCHLEDLLPVLEWCETHESTKFGEVLKSMTK